MKNQRPTAPRAPYICLLGLVVLSGALGLAYEVLWTRILGLACGHALEAASTVAATFMAGLALGGALGELPQFSRRHPLKLYGAAEVGIGLYSLLLPRLLALADPLIDRACASGAATARLLTLVWAGGLLLVPTTLMGLTIPALSRLRGPGRDPLAFLYGANCLGGCMGSLMVTFLLLPALGHRATGIFLAGTGLAIGGLALAIKRTQTSFVEEPEHAGISGWGLTVGLLAGASAMGLEMAWTRAFVLVVGSSTYAFSLILAAFIGCLSAGSHLAGVLARWMRDPFRASAGLLGLLGLGGLSSLILLRYVPLWASANLPELPSFTERCVFELALVTLVVLPATLASGMLLPVAARLPGTRFRIGHLCAANTIGSVVGTLAAVFAAIPTVGLANTIGLCSLLPLACAGGVLPAGRRLLAGSVLLLAGGITLWLLPPWDIRVLHCSPFLISSSYQVEAQRAGHSLQEELNVNGTVLYHREGSAVTVAVRETKEHERTLVVNGKPDASTSLDMKTQRLVAHLPLLVHPAARDVLVIGLGSGVSAGAALRHPIKSETLVELAPEVVEASRYFNHQSGGPLQDPRVSLIIGDGRTHVMHSRKQYDVVISEPTNPWIAGVGALFTREFFTACRARLAPGGVMSQWLQAYSLSADDFASVVRTFQAVFPEATLWRTVDGADYVLLGNTGKPIDLAGIQRAFSRPAVCLELADVEIRDSMDVLAQYVCGPSTLRRFARSARLQLDDRLDLEFNIPQKVQRGINPELALQIRALDESPAAVLAGGLTPEREQELALRRERYKAYDLAQDKQFCAALDLLAKIEKACDASSFSTAFLKGFYLSATTRMEEMGKLDQARRVLERIATRFPGDPDYQCALAGLFGRKGEVAIARELYERILARHPDAPEPCRGLGILCEARGAYPEALRHYRTLAKLSPYDPLNAAAIVRVLHAMQRPDEAKQALQLALAIDPGLPVERLTAPIPQK